MAAKTPPPGRDHAAAGMVAAHLAAMPAAT